MIRPAVACGMAAGGLLVGVQIGKLLRRGGEGQRQAEKPEAEKPGEASREVEVAAPAGGATLIDGKAIAEKVRAEVKEAAEQLVKEHNVRPGLAVVLVGERKDSQSYVKMKKKAAAEANFHSVDITLPVTVSQAALLEEVHKLNADPLVHAILVQLPLPEHIDEPTILKAIKVEKDADGFAALNIGNLCLKGGDPPLAIPCTPAGCIELLQRSSVDIRGKNAVVLGRSNIVGMPVAALLQSMDATVTVVHSRTRDMEAHVRGADIVVAAIGKAEFVRGDWLKPGCVVIDVGINAVEDATKKSGHRLVGDVHFAEAKAVASAITPVPGGVGPMTIAMLMKNTLNLARHSLGMHRLPLRKTSTVPAARKLPAEQDYAVVVSSKQGEDPWSAAVKACALREKVQELSSQSVLPSVVLQSSGNSGSPPVSLVTLGTDGTREKVVCSGTTMDEASVALGGA